MVAEESHRPSSSEGAGVDVGGREPIGWASRGDYNADGGGDIGAADLCLCPGILDDCNWGVAGGAVASKVHHTATHCRHWTPGGVAGASVPDIFALDANFLGCKNQADEVGLGKGF